MTTITVRAKIARLAVVGTAEFLQNCWFVQSPAVDVTKLRDNFRHIIDRGHSDFDRRRISLHR
jgi:hypothetical protein